MEIAIEGLISYIEKNKRALGITLYPKASEKDICFFEEVMARRLPDDLRKFYSFANGFESGEDLFRIIPLEEIIENDPDHLLSQPTDFHFAEYLIYSDIWTLSIDSQQPNTYSIYYLEDSLILTNSFCEFLSVFLQGGVFEDNGLYNWGERLAQKNQ